MKIPAVALHFGVGATLSIGLAFALSSVYEVRTEQDGAVEVVGCVVWLGG